MLVGIDRRTAARLLCIFGINPPSIDERFESGEAFDAGIGVSIHALTDSRGPALHVKIGGRRASSQCPPVPADVERLINQLHATGVLPSGELSDATLARLLEVCGKLYAETRVRAMHAIFYLTQDGYRTHAVYMTRSAA